MTTKYQFNKGDDYKIAQRHMIKLFDLFETTNMDDLKRILDSDKLISKTIEQAKQVKLKNELLVQQIRLTKLRADYFATFGREISDSSFKTIIEQPVKYTQEQWDKAWTILVQCLYSVGETPKFVCTICNQIEHTRPQMAVHIQENHEKEMRFAIT